MPTPRRTGPVWFLYFSRSSSQPMYAAPLSMHSRRAVEWQVMPVEGVHIAQGHGVFLAELQGIQPHFPGNVLHEALGGEVALGNARTPRMAPGAGRLV